MALFAGRSLRWQLPVLIGSVMVVLACIFGLIVTEKQSSQARQDFEQQMLAVAGGLASGSADPIVREDFAGLEALALRFSAYPGLESIDIVNREGKPLTSVAIGASGNPEAVYGSKRHVVPVQPTPQIEYSHESHLDFIQIFTSTEGSGLVWFPIKVGELIGWVRLSFFEVEINRAILRSLRNTMLLNMAGGMVAAFLLLLFLGKTVRNLEASAEFALRLSRMNGDQLPVSSGPLEITSLDKALNSASSRLHQQRQELLARQEELRVLTEELKTAVARAETANDAKSRFLATMSHEIRTPINGVVGMMSLLRGTQLDEQQQIYSDVAITSAQSLLHIIDDILDFSKIEAGKMEIEEIDFDLHAFLGNLQNLYEFRAASKDLSFNYFCAPDVPQWIKGDITRLRQILDNFLGNAIKFTRSGHISLIVEGLLKNEEKSLIRFRVEDTGEGISDADQQKLFKSFSQADASTTRKFGGTGLGLAITKELVELMRGKVGFLSEEGKGSFFWVEIPFEQGSALAGTSQNIDPAGVPPPACDILLVEDNKTNQAVALGMLDKLGYKNIEVAENGQQAIDAVNKKTFDVILMDCQMPVLDGYQATRDLRASGCNTPVIAMTANAMQGDREKCLAAGMDDYIAKPIFIETLRETMAKWLLSGKAVKADVEPFGTIVSSVAPVKPKVFDREEALARFGNDEALLNELLDLAADDFPQVMGKLNRAIEVNDVENIIRSVHSIKGAAANIGANELWDLAGTAEKELRGGRIDQADHYRKQLQAALDRLVEAIGRNASNTSTKVTTQSI